MKTGSEELRMGIEVATEELEMMEAGHNFSRKSFLQNWQVIGLLAVLQPQ